MEKYNISELIHAVDQLNWIECHGKRRSERGERDLVLDETVAREQVIPIIDNCSQQCRKTGLHDTFERINVDCRAHLETGHMTIHELQGHAREMRHCMKRELYHTTFILIPQHRMLEVRKILPQWNEIVGKFDKARSDVEDALDCFGVGKDTAAVFHLMRIAEWGLRALCVHLGFRNIKSKTKSGKVHLTPIEFSTWETMLNQLNGRVNKRIGKLKRGSLRQKAQEFYFPLFEEIQAFKDAWRNHVMHTRQTYTSEDVLAISSHVRRFMSSLTSHGVYQV